jgi:hypothetical protein
VHVTALGGAHTDQTRSCCQQGRPFKLCLQSIDNVLFAMLMLVGVAVLTMSCCAQDLRLVTSLRPMSAALASHARCICKVAPRKRPRISCEGSEGTRRLGALKHAAPQRFKRSALSRLTVSIPSEFLAHAVAVVMLLARRQSELTAASVFARAMLASAQDRDEGRQQHGGTIESAQQPDRGESASRKDAKAAKRGAHRLAWINRT